ncbi:MAG: hypothetical protein IPF68_16785 [Bacteroidales bacterium]|nr:hypothetical protein [Bacteroidales bacterium]
MAGLSKSQPALRVGRQVSVFSVAASGGDLTGGNYGWLFTSGGGNP